MKKAFSTIIFVLFFAVYSFAQEGMWLLNQIDGLDLGSKGLKISTGEIYSKDSPALYQAIVQLGGGTASFVSPEGLLVTNHHVAYTALQRASNKDHDYITDGYLANTKQDEIKAAGYQARLLIEMRDVTNEVYSAVNGITDPIAMNTKINQKIAEMREQSKGGKEDIDVRIADMFNGKQYIL
ncbi:MAG: S46 family peptidase, partial [Bacteroidetes bacterium]|nr:S46 family peptidase [Bacteroidota bacterium]